MCHDCAFQPYCGSDPVYHYATQGDYVGNKIKSEFCGRNMAIFKKLIDYIENDEEVLGIFKSWMR